MKQTLVKTGSYELMYAAIEKQLLGFQLKDLEKNSTDPRSKELQHILNTFVPKTYIQAKIESIIDSSDSWIRGVNTSEPEVSFEDLKTKILQSNANDVNQLTDFLQTMQDQLKNIKQEQQNQSTTTPNEEVPSLDLQNLINKNAVIKLAPYLLPFKIAVQFVKIAFPVAIVFLGILITLMLLLSPTINSKLRFLALTALSGAIGLLLLHKLTNNPESLLLVITRALPLPVRSIFQTIGMSLIIPQVTALQKLLMTVYHALSLTAIVSAAFSFVDFTFEKKTMKRNSIIIALSLFTSLCAFVFLFGDVLPAPLRLKKNSTNVPIKPELSLLKKTEKLGSKGLLTVTTGADASFKLDIPKNATVYGATITSSIINGIGNLPDGATLVTGIDFTSTDEVILKKPGTLTINLQKTPLGKLRAFSYESNGSHFTTYPVTVTNNAITLDIQHMSGYGLITVPDTFPERETTNDVRSSSQADIRDILGAIQLFQAFGKNESITDKQLQGLGDILETWWNDGVHPILSKSLSSEEAIVPATKEYLIWLQSVQAFGLEKRFSQLIKTSEETIAKAIMKASAQASTVCIKQKDPSQVGKLLKLYAIAEMLGIHSVAGLDVDAIRKNALDCTHFRVEIQSHFVSEDKVCTGEDETYSGSIELTVDDDFTLSGKGTVKADTIAVCEQECRIQEGDGPVETTVEIPGVAFSSTKTAPEVYLPFVVTDETSVQYDCTYTVPGTNGEGEVGYSRPFGWSGSFYNMHEDEEIEPFEVIIRDWNILNAKNAYAVKEYDRTKTPTFLGTGVPVHEITTLKLIHTPKE